MTITAPLSATSFGLPAPGPFDPGPLAAAAVRDDPYPYLIARGCLAAAALPALRRDFPRLGRSGYHPVDAFTPEGSFAALLDQIEDGVLERAIGGRLGIDLARLPRLVTVHFTAARREGRPHTDGERKVATLLLYMNQHWTSEAGRIRVLRSDRLEDAVAELPPEEGNVLAFRRTDRSWHGHAPVAGERRVVQVTWLRDAAAAERKRRTGLFAWRLKGLFGGGRPAAGAAGPG